MKFGTNDFFFLYRFIFLETIDPLSVPVLFQQSGHSSQRLFAVAQNGNVYLYILIYFRRINIKMDHFRLFGVSSQITGHTVVETHTDSNQYITFVSIDIRSQISVHTQHSFIQRMVGRQCGKSEQGTTCGHIRLFDKGTQFFLSASQFHSLSYQDKRAFGVIDQFGGSLYRFFVCIGNRNIAADKLLLCRLVFRFFNLRILGKVEYHRTGTTTTGNVESTCYCPGYVFGTANLIAPFSDWLSDTYEIDFLKSVCSKKACSHLSCNDNDRRTVYHRICNTCDRIGCSGAACHQANTDFTRYTGVALCRMGSSLFMANQDMVQCILMVVQGIERRHDGTAGITENGSHSLMFQRAHHCLCACY